MNMMKAYDPASAFRLWFDMVRMGCEAQFIIGMRLAGMMGFLPHAADENFRMVSEKGDAAREAITLALRAAARGRRADQVLSAALKPYSKRTRANAGRLGRSS